MVSPHLEELEGVVHLDAHGVGVEVGQHVREDVVPYVLQHHLGAVNYVCLVCVCWGCVYIVFGCVHIHIHVEKGGRAAYGCQTRTATYTQHPQTQRHRHTSTAFNFFN